MCPDKAFQSDKNPAYLQSFAPAYLYLKHFSFKFEEGLPFSHIYLPTANSLISSARNPLLTNYLAQVVPGGCDERRLRHLNPESR